MPVTLIKSKWSSGSLVFYPKTDDTGTINIGDGTYDCDLKIFLGSTTEYVNFDVGDSTMYCTAVLRASGNTIISGTVGVSGAVALSGATVISGTTTLSGTTTVSGAATITGTATLQGVTTISAATTISTATATTISNYGAAIFAFTSATTIISDSTDGAGTASGYISVKIDGNVRYVYTYDAAPA